MAAAAPRRRRIIGHRRRLRDDGEDESGPDALDTLEDDSLTEGSVVSDDNDQADDSDTSNIDEASPTSPIVRKSSGNGVVKTTHQQADSSATERKTGKPIQAVASDTDFMLNGLTITEQTRPVAEMDFDEIQTTVSKDSAPIVVSSSSAQPHENVPLHERRRREHDEYRRKRDEDPSFVPNRGAFFMHDHRHQGPSANGFRPFGRPGRGRGRGGLGGTLAQVNQFHNAPDPTTSAPWAHDMHEVIATAQPNRYHRHLVESAPHGDTHIPRCPSNPTPINRTMSTEKHLGNVQVRVFFPPMKAPAIFSGTPIKQYILLPDHRPPLRRDKPVRISLPGHQPRYIYPAGDRSFIFIPRAQRPNHKGMRGKPRSGFGSVSAFSRRTSVFGGSIFGSTYSPSIALSRRSSLAPDIGRDYIISPTGSAISRISRFSRPPLPLPMDTSRPVVRLPPMARTEQPPPPRVSIPATQAPSAAQIDPPTEAAKPSITELPPPQTYPLQQKSTFEENQQNPIPMHQPRPQKTVSVETIESPTLTLNPPQPYHQPFHQQVPLQMSNGFGHESHNRNSSYPSQHSTGTPLSQIPERAIHAAPFQPNAYPQQGFYGQPYPMMQPQQNYYYPTPYASNMGPSAATQAFVPGAQQPQTTNYGQQAQGDAPVAHQQNPQAPATQNLVAQEVNGMVYYYDASQLQSVAAANYQSYPGPQNYVPGVVGMGGMMTPSPDTFYYTQPGPGMVYYAQ